MALFDANRNRNYKPYISTEPVYGGITYPDNVHHPFVGYSETQNSSYVTTTEQVVEFRRFGAIADDHKHSPTRKTVYKDHGVADKSLSRLGAQARLKTDDFSPKFHNQFVYSQSKEYGYQDIIDSAEARRRYSRASPRAAEEKYMGTIDSREAARKYNGVFMSNW
ncbi:hypothetical protein DH2020_029276 [Rehmannia glutinosa]|uniref:Uncharacterized protein n=1 Tax=Rehmannia glutinosa TaxID=99300 RepID=A0ABR0VRN6_REHGL